MQPADIFEVLASELEQRPGVSRNARGSLVRGGVRAMTSQGRVVVRLDPARVLELVGAGSGRHYKDQVNAWLELDPELAPDEVRALVVEALD